MIRSCTLKIHFILFALISISISSNAQQILTGEQASNHFSQTTLVRLDSNTQIPSYVRFEESNDLTLANFENWLQKRFNLGTLSLTEIERHEDRRGETHVKYQQVHNGISIASAIWIVHLKGSRISAMNGQLYQLTTPSTILIDKSAALERALNAVGANTYKWELLSEENHLKMESGDQTKTYYPTGDLVYFSEDYSFKSSSFRLAYAFDIYAHAPLSRSIVYIDATTGALLQKEEVIHHIDTPGNAHTAYSGEREIIADSHDGTYRLRDGSRGNGIRTFDLNTATSYGGAVDFVDTDNDWNNVNPERDEYATDAHWGAEMTYDYFFEEHDRNGIDDAGFQLNSYVHYSVGYVNAFWDGFRMTYGDGNDDYSPLTSLDIVGHEITHGLTNKSANLIYYGESGALNESFSDIFGTAIERFARPDEWNWTIADEIGTTFRSLSAPNTYYDPDTYEGGYWYAGHGDSGGVHQNSGVQNFWFYLLSEGGTGINDNGTPYTVTGLGFDAAAEIAFRNLTVYLTPGSQYNDARFFAIQSAIDLYGACSHEVEQTVNAWEAVGLSESYADETVANFSVTGTTFGCEAPFSIKFNNSSINATSYLWDFGDGTTSAEYQPVHTYTETGVYSVTLTSSSECGEDTKTAIDFIEIDPTVDCEIILPTRPLDTAHTQYGCEGTLYDSGGPDGDYARSEIVTITIAPHGASNVTLDFESFFVQNEIAESCIYDYLKLYDGPDIYSPVVDTFCNLSPPPPTYTSSGPAVTLVFKSSGNDTAGETGFQIDWSCIMPTEAPNTYFESSADVACVGPMGFVDLSDNYPTEWYWEFGDGGTSTAQHPTHIYLDEGTYTVTLIATNGVGSNTYEQEVTVTFPTAPSTTGDEVCPLESAALNATGAGNLKWFVESEGGTYVYMGESFSTPPLEETTTYYVQDETYGPSQFVGPENASFGDANTGTSSTLHFIFDCHTPLVLKSIKCYSSTAGTRIVELRNSDGEVLESKEVYIPFGFPSTIELDMDIPAGDNLELGLSVESLVNLTYNWTDVSYPYTIPGYLEIEACNLPWVYPYFYDWEVVTKCESERVPVVATVLEMDVSIDLPEPICWQSEPVTLTASEPDGEWSADCDDCVDPITGVFNPAIAGIGDWEVVYESAMCAVTDTITVNVIDCLGLSSNDAAKLEIYPNPTNGELTIIAGVHSKGTIRVESVLGEVIIAIPFNSNKFAIDLSNHLADGMYLLSLIDENDQKIAVSRLIIQ